MNIATRCAQVNREKNSGRALREGLDWVYARDGAMSARDRDGKWITGCSVPRRAAMAQMRKLDVQGSVACFLAPPHAAAVRVAIEKLRPEQACVAIAPDESDLDVMLACEDFSRELTDGRLFFIAGEDWTTQLRALFERSLGLSIPTQFIRLPSTDAEIIDPMIVAAQQVFSQIVAARSQRMSDLRSKRGRTPFCIPFCVVAPSGKRLWNEWGNLLRESLNDLRDGECIFVDPDRPTQSSPLAVAETASVCEAIVTIDVTRADVPGVVNDETPWVTWVTGGKIPERASCGKLDRLMMADPRDVEVARALGWAAKSVCVAQPRTHRRENASRGITIIAELISLEPPTNIDDFSSHRVLWESVADELTRDPFAIGADPEKYLDSRMRTLHIDPATLNRAKFMSMLVAPAYQMGLQRLLEEHDIPFQSKPDASSSTTQRDKLLDNFSALIHVWPDQQRVHAIDFCGLPVIRPGLSKQNFLQEVRAAIAGRVTPVKHCAPVICGKLIREFLAAE